MTAACGFTRVVAKKGRYASVVPFGGGINCSASNHIPPPNGGGCVRAGSQPLPLLAPCPCPAMPHLDTARSGNRSTLGRYPIVLLLPDNHRFVLYRPPFASFDKYRLPFCITLLLAEPDIRGFGAIVPLQIGKHPRFFQRNHPLCNSTLSWPETWPIDLTHRLIRPLGKHQQFGRCMHEGRSRSPCRGVE